VTSSPPFRGSRGHGFKSHRPDRFFERLYAKYSQSTAARAAALAPPMTTGPALAGGARAGRPGNVSDRVKPVSGARWRPAGQPTSRVPVAYFTCGVLEVCLSDELQRCTRVSGRP